MRLTRCDDVLRPIKGSRLYPRLCRAGRVEDETAMDCLCTSIIRVFARWVSPASYTLQGDDEWRAELMAQASIRCAYQRKVLVKDALNGSCYACNTAETLVSRNTVSFSQRRMQRHASLPQTKFFKAFSFWPAPAHKPSAHTKNGAIPSR